jgi:hypothetical protein
VDKSDVWRVGRRSEVRYAVPSDIEYYIGAGETFLARIYGPGYQFERIEEVAIYSPRNVAFDSEDVDVRQWAHSGTLPADTFVELYEPVEQDD